MYLKGCTGKKPYFSLVEANHFLRKIHKQGGHKPPRLYICHFDTYGQTHWHMTSIPKRKESKIRKEQKKWIKKTEKQFRRSSELFI